jgi:GTP-binding protein Era
LPEQDAFYSGDELTDRSERFIVAELIREKIFEQFQKEVPYSCEVIIQDWKDAPDITHIRAEIIAERESQKAIILGKGGSAIKNLGTLARRDIETFLGKKIFLGLTVKVNSNWRNNPTQLKYFGYLK